MTAAAPSRTAPRQTAMQRLAGGLALVCLVLFLLAIEQKQAVEAWQIVRDEAAPAAGRVVDWAGRLPSGAADGLTGLKTAVAGKAGPVAASSTDVVLTGAFSPADEAARTAGGAVQFVGGAVRFDTGETLHTRPLRIAAGRENFALGQTFAGRLDAPADAQIELRRIVPASQGEAVSPSPLCGDQAPGVIALLYRQDRVDLMLFRAGTIVGSDAPPSALCGAWRFHRR